MANTVIKLKKSSVPAEVPSTLEYGELAINYADGKFYYKNSAGQIVSFSAANVYSFATINANNSLITAISNNSTLTINPGDNISINGDIINDIVTISANLKSVYDVANSAYGIANNALSIGGFPIGDYMEGEAVIGAGGGVDAFGISDLLSFDCNKVGPLSYSDLGVLT